MQCALGFFFLAGSVQPPWGKMVVLILPALLLGMLAFFAAKGELGVLATVICTTVLAIALSLASVLYTGFLAIESLVTVTTDTSYYSRAYKAIDHIDEVKYIFPKTIPVDAEDVTFRYNPQFLQGGEIFELSYTTTDEKLAQWNTLLESQAQWVGTDEQWHEKLYGSSLHGTDAMRYQLLGEGRSNHGEECYVLIDRELEQITFYYSIW